MRSLLRHGLSHIEQIGEVENFTCSTQLTRQILDILKNARQPMLTVCLSDAVKQVRAEIRAGKKSSAPISGAVAASKATRAS